MKSKLSKPVLFMFYGMPGSGKTHTSLRLAKELGAAHVSAEEIRFQLFEKPSFSLEEEGVVKHMMLMMTERFLQFGLPVIFDTNVYLAADRRELRNLAKKHKAECFLIWQQLDQQTALERISKRSGKEAEDKFAVKIDPQTFQTLVNKMQSPSNEDSIVVSSKHSFKGQLQTILRKLFEKQLTNDQSLAKHLPNPGLVNLVAQTKANHLSNRRNINVGS